MNTITINKHEIPIKEYNGQRVVTFKEIDEVHEKAPGAARKRFNGNKKRFVEGEDFFKISPSEFRTAFCEMDPRQQNDITLITESGYLMLVKSFTDDLVWAVQRELVNSYFRIREILTPNLDESTPAPMRMLTVDDYLLAAKMVAFCKKSRLPLVVSILEKAGITSQEELDAAVKSTDTGDISERLQETLENTGLSKHFLAKRLGLSDGVFDSYLKKRRFPRPDRYNAIIAVLDRLEDE